MSSGVWQAELLGSAGFVMRSPVCHDRRTRSEAERSVDPDKERSDWVPKRRRSEAEPELRNPVTELRNRRTNDKFCRSQEA